MENFQMTTILNVRKNNVLCEEDSLNKLYNTMSSSCLKVEKCLLNEVTKYKCIVVILSIYHILIMYKQCHAKAIHHNNLMWKLIKWCKMYFLILYKYNNSIILGKTKIPILINLIEIYHHTKEYNTVCMYDTNIQT